MIVILNGPIGVGKDTIADILVAHFPKYAKAEFKHDMFKIAFAMSGVAPEVFMKRHNDRKLKEEPWELLSGLSTRRYLIHISEVVMKPLHGKHVFGKRAADRCLAATGLGLDVVFSDGGFPEEGIELVEAGHNVLVIHLYRDGCNMSDDPTRGYMHIEGATTIRLALQTGKAFSSARSVFHLVEDTKHGSS